MKERKKEFGKFPLKMSNFSIFFPSDQKNRFGSGRKVPGSKPGRPLIYCGSKVSSGRVGSGPISNVYIFSYSFIILYFLKLKMNNKFVKSYLFSVVLHYLDEDQKIVGLNSGIPM